MIAIITDVFLFAGFLESGKTTALQETLLKAKDIPRGRVLIICTEEGEIEYQEELLKPLGIDVVTIFEEEDFTKEYLNEISNTYKPDSVYIECNGMWDLKELVVNKLPEDWSVVNIFSFVNAMTYELYMKNMRQAIMNPLSISTVILFNRCDDSTKKDDIRRTLRMFNNRAEVFFIKKDGSIDNTAEELYIEERDGMLDIDDSIFGQWFVDCIDNTDKYYGKFVRLKMMVSNTVALERHQLYLGRYIAACCEEDATFVGFIADYEGKKPKHGDWVNIEGRISKGLIGENKVIILLKINKLEITDEPLEKYLYI